MGKKLRIAVWYNLPSGGGKRALYYHVRELVRRGHHVEAWRPPVPDLEFSPIGSLVAEHECPLIEAPPDERTYLRRVQGFVNQHRRKIAAMQEHSDRAAREMAESGFDVLFAANCMFYHAPFIGRAYRGPKVLYLQEPKRSFYEAGERLLWRAREPMPKTASARSKLIAYFRDHVEFRAAREVVDEEYRNAASFDEILVNSLFSRESVKRAYGISPRLCYLGIDAEMFRAAAVSKDPYVIGVGVVAPPKNIEFLIDALATISIDRPRLVWVANRVEDAYAARLLAQANRLGVELDIKQMVSDQELQKLLAHATAMVYAPRLEPFGFAPLEANACGTAAIVVAEGGVRETIIDGLNGFVVDAVPEEMGARIRELLGNPALALSMGAAAAAHVREHWTWEASGDILEQRLIAACEGAR